MLNIVNFKKDRLLNIDVFFCLNLFFLTDAFTIKSLGASISWALLIGLVVLLHNIALSRDLITSCVGLLFIFILSGILLCVYDLMYIGVLYLLVYAGGLSILFIFIIFLFDLEKDYTSSINSFGLIALFICCILLSGLYAEFCKVSVLEESQPIHDTGS